VNLYDEFFSIISLLSGLGIRYAVGGGIALAFHARPRFTRDIDILVHQDDMSLVKMAMDRLGYEETAEPSDLADTPLNLHRFLKIEGQEELMIDILVANGVTDSRPRTVEAQSATWLTLASARSFRGMIGIRTILPMQPTLYIDF
jgi:hypothetical protein